MAYRDRPGSSGEAWRVTRASWHWVTNTAATARANIGGRPS